MRSSPKVSIVIVNLDHADLTIDCVSSIIDNTEAGLYEIIVVDNGSTAPEIEKLIRLQSRDITLVRLNRNLFFGEANNIAAERARGEYIVVLNNDVKVDRHWLTELLGVLENEICAGAVGPKILYPDGTLQEAGSYILPDGWTVQMGKSGPAPLHYDARPQPVDYCSAACLIMKRSNFLQLGGFDPIFDPAYFEDVDLCIRLRSLGLFTYYCSQAVVFHEENVTSRRIWTPKQRQDYIVNNHDKFFKRWGDYLQQRMNANCEPASLPPIKWDPEPELATTKKIALLYLSHTLTTSPPSQSMLMISHAFQESHDVIIAGDEIVSRCRVYSLCRELGLNPGSFRVRNISDVNQSEADIIISFGQNTKRISHAHFVFERDWQQLLEFMERLN